MTRSGGGSVAGSRSSAMVTLPDASPLFGSPPGISPQQAGSPGGNHQRLEADAPGKAGQHVAVPCRCCQGRRRSTTDGCRASGDRHSCTAQSRPAPSAHRGKPLLLGPAPFHAADLLGPPQGLC